MSRAATQLAMSRRPHAVPAKNLDALLAGIVDGVPAAVRVSDLSLDSRTVKPGSAFIALPGLRSHGATFASSAVSAGATVVLWEPTPGVAAPQVPDTATVIAIPDLTRKLGTIADRFFDAPSQALRITGVTGTNGKTTSAFLLAAALERLGLDAAYAGTVGVGRLAALRPAAHTTPDCISVHRELSELREDGVRFVAMEVSSHALDQHRVAGVRFETAVFTNLTHDHLDYHGTIEAYACAKRRLFEWPALKHAILNVDDLVGLEIATHARASIVTGYGRGAAAFAASNEHRRYVQAQSVSASASGLEIAIDSSRGAARLQSRLIGAFNVDNLLAVLATLLALDVPLAAAVRALEECNAPPGRLEKVTAPGRPAVIVDYAHTPDALRKALDAIRRHYTGRIVCVFGCGGERDAAKRPLMGAIAEREADATVVTDDNPRNENANDIVAAILSGMQRPERAVVERDRARAIELAISQAQPGDAVLIAGKGHEDYQIVGATRRPFSDRDVALAALGRRA